MSATNQNRIIRYILIAFSLLILNTANAGIIFNQAPDQPGAVTGGSLASIAHDQQIADEATFASAVTLTGMDTYGLDNSPMNVGDAVRVRIFEDNNGVPLYGAGLHDFIEVVSIADLDGTDGITDPGGTTITRYHASFSSQVTLQAGTYWFSMSKVGGGFSQMTLSSLDSGDTSYRFVNGPFTGVQGFGDMAFRLHDASQPVPEPSTYAMLFFGLVGLGIYHKKRKK